MEEIIWLAERIINIQIVSVIILAFTPINEAYVEHVLTRHSAPQQSRRRDKIKKRENSQSKDQSHSDNVRAGFKNQALAQHQL